MREPCPEARAGRPIFTLGKLRSTAMLHRHRRRHKVRPIAINVSFAFALKNGFSFMDIGASSELEVAFSIGAQNQAEHQGRTPLGVIVYVAAPGLAQALWLGLIGWWVLNLF
jgi:hypothetical protein